MSTPPCANDSLLETYRSTVYQGATSFNLLVTVASWICVLRACWRLSGHTIIAVSSRVLIFFALGFAFVHQIAYFGFKALILYEILFKLDSPCELYHTNHECRFYTIGVTTGNCGLVLIQVAMSFDRTMCLVGYGSKLALGWVLGAIVFAASFSLFFILTLDDPMDSYVANCGFWPSVSFDRFTTMISVLFYITMVNILVDLVILRASFWREKQVSTSFNVANRFRIQSSLKSIQAMFTLSIAQFFFMAAYSGITWIMLKIRENLTDFQYSVLLSLNYTTPYACLTLPLVLCALLRHIKNQRANSITSLTSHRETQEQHMQRMAKMWL